MRTNSNGAHSPPHTTAQQGYEAKYRRASLLLSVMLLFTTLFYTSLSGATEEGTIAVIYPDIGEPYQQIFTKIIEGIESEIGARIGIFPMRADTSISNVKASLLNQHTKVVIALGRQGIQTAVTLNDGIAVVAGGVLTVRKNETLAQRMISLAPDPAMLFAKLKALMPNTKRIFVVYDSSLNGWLIKLAQEAARAKDIELVAYETQDLRSALRFYQQIFAESDSRSDAIWLPQDSTTVEENSILPFVLQHSWDQGLAVFSSNVGHVRRGVLFSLYPDNVALGKSLADLAQHILLTGDLGKHAMLPLRDVQSAVNLRTAAHLGINLDRVEVFDLTFPEQ
jgi:putative ABC transport system substrate-binding protein